MSFVGWLWWIAGGAIGVAGLVVLLRAVFGDRSRGRRRCPKCWYSMEGHAGARCPECGREQKREKRLYRTRRHWRMAALGVLLLIVCGGCFFAQRVHRHGWVKATPTAVYIAALPHLDGNAGYSELESRVEDGALRQWEYRLLVHRLIGLVEKQDEDAGELSEFAKLLYRIEVLGRNVSSREPHRSWAMVSEIDRDSAITALVDLLGYPDASVQIMAVQALGQFTDQAAMAYPALVGMLTSDDQRIQEAAAESMVFIHPPGHDRFRVVPTAMWMIAPQGLDEDVAQLSRDLAPCGVDTACSIPVLLNGLNSDDEEVRRVSLFALVLIADTLEDHAPYIMEMCEDEDEDVRATAVRALALLPINEEREEIIREAIFDFSEQVRLTTMGMLEELGPDGSRFREDVRQLMESDTAVFDHHQIYNPPAAALRGPGNRVRIWAARAFVSIGGEPETAVRAMLRAFDAERFDVNGTELLATIAEIGVRAPELAEQIEPLLASDETLIRSSAAYAYGVLSGDADRATRLLFETQRVELASQAMAIDASQRLRRMCDDGFVSIPVLMEMLDSSNPTDREIAATLLERSGARALPALEKLRKLINDPNGRLATNAASAVERLEYEQASRR